MPRLVRVLFVCNAGNSSTRRASEFNAFLSERKITHIRADSMGIRLNRTGSNGAQAFDENILQGANHIVPSWKETHAELESLNLAGTLHDLLSNDRGIPSSWKESLLARIQSEKR